MERKVAHVDPALYERYVGVYALPGERKVEVTREGGRLFAQFAGAPKMELFPESERKFFLQVPGVDVQTTFAEGPKAASVTVHQGGLDTLAPRVD